MTNNYKLPTQPDVMTTTHTFGYDVQAGAWTYNGCPIRREGLLLVDEPRTPQQIVADLTAGLQLDEETTALEQIMHGQEVQQ